MARPNPETKYQTFTELYVTNSGSSSGFYNYPFYNRTYYSVSNPLFPRERKWQPHAFYTQIGSRKTSCTLYEFYPAKPQLGWGDYKIGWASAQPNFPEMDTVEHLKEIIQSCNNKHMDEIQGTSVNIAQMLAERKQVASLVANTAIRIAEALRNIRRGDVSIAAHVLGFGSKAKPSTGSVASDWLALQYGWKPLLQDVYGSCQLLASTHHRPWRIEVETRKTGRRERNHKGYFYSSYPSPGTYNGVVTTKVKQVSVYEVSNELIRLGGQTGITNPALLAWELLPYSFVADWFLPVGAFLQRLNYDSGLAFVSGLQTYFSTFSGKYTAAGTNDTWVPGQNAFLRRISTGSFTSDVLRLERSLRGPLSPDIPVFKDPFSPTHALNAIALMRGTFRP